jgi:hypothetical protein
MTVSTLPRAHSFADDITATLRDADPSDITDLAERLYDLHETQMGPMRSQVNTLTRELTRVHEDHRRATFMLGQAEALAATVTQQVTRHAATIAHQNETLRKIRGLAQGNFEGTVSAEDLAALLTIEHTPPTCHSIPLGFYPSDQFRGGVFASHDGAVRVTYTFVGWTNVARYVGGGVSTEPTFLVADRGALPASTIEMERDLRLEMPLLPNLSAAA